VQAVDEDEIESPLVLPEVLVGGHPMGTAALGIHTDLVVDPDRVEDLVPVAPDLEVAVATLARREALQKIDAVVDLPWRGRSGSTLA
jgi:hypothetical protein